MSQTLEKGLGTLERKDWGRQRVGDRERERERRRRRRRK